MDSLVVSVNNKPQQADSEPLVEGASIVVSSFNLFGSFVGTILSRERYGLSVPVVIHYR
jgi:hypothetical protein